MFRPMRKGRRPREREGTMGFEIVYCGGCGNRLMSGDFSEGRAIRSGQGARCVPCADKGTKRLLRKPPSSISPRTPAPRP